MSWGPSGKASRSCCRGNQAPNLNRCSSHSFTCSGFTMDRFWTGA